MSWLRRVQEPGQNKALVMSRVSRVYGGGHSVL